MRFSLSLPELLSRGLSSALGELSADVLTAARFALASQARKSLMGFAKRAKASVLRRREQEMQAKLQREMEEFQARLNREMEAKIAAHKLKAAQARAEAEAEAARMREAAERKARLASAKRRRDLARMRRAAEVKNHLHRQHGIKNPDPGTKKEMISFRKLKARPSVSGAGPSKEERQFMDKQQRRLTEIFSLERCQPQLQSAFYSALSAMRLDAIGESRTCACISSHNC